MKKITLLSLSKQHGYLMIQLAIMIVIVGFIGAAVVNMFYWSSLSTNAHYESDQALYLAEAGIEHATHKLLEPTLANRQSCATYNSTALTNSLGAGSYSVSVSPSGETFWPAIYFPIVTSTPATLSSAIGSTDTTIAASTTSNYAPSGRIMIDTERINYQGTTSTSFTNVTRGVDGTTAMAHAMGTPIGQYQCNLVATASVPSVASPRGVRTVNASVEMQDGFIVGDASSTGNTILEFNYPLAVTNNIWNSVGAPSASGVNLYGTYWLSNADGWFVGTNYLQRFQRAATYNYTPPVNANYRSVFCTSANACHAVGDVSITDILHQVIIDWNGSSWTRTAATGLNTGTNLKSVHCDSSTDCWAVGDITGGPVFYHWTGAAPWTGVAEILLSYPYNSVFCNAATDCWAVGATNIFARLTSGTTWTNYTANSIPIVQYNSISCNNSTDCWAVGNFSLTSNVFVHWNGTAWSMNSSNPSPLSNLYGVACYGTNDCWAVGSAVLSNTPQMFHWDGTSWTTNSTFVGNSIPAATLRSISLVGRNSTQPISSWSETFN